MITKTNPRKKRSNAVVLTSLLMILGLSIGPASYSPTLRKLYPFKLGLSNFKQEFMGTHIHRTHSLYCTRRIINIRENSALLNELTDEEFFEIVRSYEGPINWNSLYGYVLNAKNKKKVTEISIP